MRAPCKVEAVVNCPPSRVWGQELVWRGIDLQIGTCAHPSTKGEWMISSPEFVLHLEASDLSQHLSTPRGRAEPREAVTCPTDNADVPQTTDHFGNASKRAASWPEVFLLMTANGNGEFHCTGYKGSPDVMH